MIQKLTTRIFKTSATYQYCFGIKQLIIKINIQLYKLDELTDRSINKQNILAKSNKSEMLNRVKSNSNSNYAGTDIAF